MIRVALADDHPVVRAGIRALLQAASDIEIVGECADGLALPALVVRERPQVVVTDLAMPGLGGLEVVRRLSQVAPETAAVILSIYGDEAYVVEALRAGARAYVLKDASADHLLLAVRTVAAGGRYLSPPLSEIALERHRRLRAEAEHGDPWETLTPREREVLSLGARGLTAGQVAARLHISPRTVEIHRGSALRKLDLRTQTELVRFAVRRGLVPLDPQGDA